MALEINSRIFRSRGVFWNVSTFLVNLMIRSKTLHYLRIACYKILITASVSGCFEMMKPGCC